MSDPSFRPLNLGDAHDDDGQVIDSLVMAESTPPTPPVTPIVTPALPQPAVPTRLLSVRQSVDPTWANFTQLLPEDTRRKYLTLAVAAGAATPTVTTPVNPAVGVSNVDFTVPAGEYWELVSARYSLLTSATAGGRVPLLSLYDPQNVNYLTISSGLSYTTVSASRTWNWWVGGICSNGSDNLGGNGLPENLILAPGTVVRLNVGSLDAGDQIQNAGITYRNVAAESGIVVRSDNGGGTGLARVTPGNSVSLDNYTGSVWVKALGTAVVNVDVWSVTE